MVRFVALLPLIVACNAGPLQSGDAETWNASDQGGECVRAVASDPWSTEACVQLRSAYSRERPLRQVSGRAITIGIDSCLAALRADDSVAPVTCLVPEVRRTASDGSWTNYAFTLTTARVAVTRESFRMTARLTWTVGGVVSRSVGDSYPVRAEFTTDTTLSPVR